jgi:iron complex transport system substrate-binding protein
MRIVSLVPSATEILFALGLGEMLVGVTHECDYPLAARQKPIITSPEQTDCDAHAEECAESSEGLQCFAMAIDQDLLAQLEPDLIIVASPPHDTTLFYPESQATSRFTQAEPRAPRVIPLVATSIADLFTSIRLIADATGTKQQGEELITSLLARIDRVHQQLAGVTKHPRVACLEWLEPLFGPGLWLPELIALAGGKPGLGTAGMGSRRVSWGDVIAFAPEILIIAIHGYDLEQAEAALLQALPYRVGWHALPAVRNKQVYIVDTSAYITRLGPRIVDSLDVLAELIHPDECAGWGPRQAWRTIQTSTPTPANHCMTPIRMS